MKTLTVQIIERKDHNKNITSFIKDEKINIIAKHKTDMVAFNFAKKNKPSIILFNLNSVNNELLQYIDFLSKKIPASKVLIVGNRLPQDHELKCFLAGANGFLEYQMSEKFLIKAIKVVNEGEIWMTRKMTAIFLDHLRSCTSLNQRVEL